MPPAEPPNERPPVPASERPERDLGHEDPPEATGGLDREAHVDADADADADAGAGGADADTDADAGTDTEAGVGQGPGTEPAGGVDRARGWASRWARRNWDWAVVATLGLFMLFTRLRSFDEFARGDRVHFFGTDPYYHARHVLYTVDHFPRTLHYDPMTQFPYGTTAGQFGTLFDQLAAGLAWLVGLVVDGGQPTRETVMAVFVAYPAILGALVIVPVYLFARDRLDRGSALFAALVLAILPGAFLVRSLAGYGDHHVMEALLSVTALWAFTRALRRWDQAGANGDEGAARRLVDRPALIRDPVYRRPLAASLLAAVAFWAFFSVWPPAVLFLAIAGAFLVGELVLDHVRGRDPAPLVATSVTMLVPLTVFLLLERDAPGFNAVNPTWMQPIAALLVLVGVLVLARASGVWTRRRWPRWAFPLAAAGLFAVGLLVVNIVLPALWAEGVAGLKWMTGIGLDPGRRTISETKPADLARMYQDFGLLFYTAGAGVVIALVGTVRGRDRADLLLVLWAVAAASAAFSQVRFLYYLAVVVALANGELASGLYRAATRLSKPLEAQAPARAGAKRPARHGHRAQPSGAATGGTGDGSGPAGWAAAMVVLVLVATLVPVHVSGAGDRCDDGNAWQLADCFGPGDDVRWQRTLHWVRDNTPGIPLGLGDAYGPAPAAGHQYAYPDGTYGVLSWWDYGHQVLLEAERPPVANPFQQQASLAADVFTTRGEGDALAVLDDYLGDGPPVRYLVSDDEMASTKFFAITVWAGAEDTYLPSVRRPFVTDDGQRVDLPTRYKDAVGSMFLIHLVHGDGDGYAHLRLVHEDPLYAWLGNRGRLPTDGDVRVHRYNDILGHGTADDVRQRFGSLTYRSGDRVFELANERIWYDVRVVSALKVFERVPGAVLAGEGEPGQGVEAVVELETLNTGRTFTHRVTGELGPDGTFQLTVPYSTTGDVPRGQGGTVLDVRATGPYRVTVGDASGSTVEVHVPDADVLRGGTVQVPGAPGLLGTVGAGHQPGARTLLLP